MKQTNGKTQENKVNPLVVGGVAIAGAAAAIALSKKENREKVAKGFEEAKKRGEKLTKQAIKAIEQLREEPIVEEIEDKAKALKAKTKSKTTGKN